MKTIKFIYLIMLIIILVVIVPMEKNTEKELTTISIKRSTKDRLMEFGKKGDTYDDILNRVMDGYKHWLEKRKEMPLVMLKEEE